MAVQWALLVAHALDEDTGISEAGMGDVKVKASCVPKARTTGSLSEAIPSSGRTKPSSAMTKHA